MLGAFTGVVLLGLVNNVLVLRNTSTFWIDAVERRDHPARARARARDRLGKDLSARLAGKVCIVTGAGSGIGRASALLFAAEGAQVVAADLDEAAAAATVAEIGGESVAEQVDVADEDATRALAASTVEQLRSDRRPLQQRGHRRRRRHRGDVARALGAGDARQRSRRVPDEPRRRPADDRAALGLDREHVVRDRADGARAPRLVRRVEGRGARADASRCRSTSRRTASASTRSCPGRS